MHGSIRISHSAEQYWRSSFVSLLRVNAAFALTAITLSNLSLYELCSVGSFLLIGQNIYFLCTPYWENDIYVTPAKHFSSLKFSSTPRKINVCDVENLSKSCDLSVSCSFSNVRTTRKIIFGKTYLRLYSHQLIFRVQILLSTTTNARQIL